MKNYIGCLIRQKRLEKNISQEGLCKGICVVSYLSKIENGQVAPSVEIVKQLFQALKIEYITDQRKIDELRQLIQRFFDQYFHQEKYDDTLEQITNRATEYEASELKLEYQMARLYAEMNLTEGNLKECDLKELLEFERQVEYMDSEERFLYAFLRGSNSKDSIDVREKWYHLAGREKDTCLVTFEIAHLYFYSGQYLKTIEYSRKAYEQAAEEGNVYVMLESSHLTAICYSNHSDATNMIKYFRQTIELARVLKPELMKSVYYNMGATYTQWGRYEEAIFYLKKGLEIKPQEPEELLLEYHKLTFCYHQLGKLQKKAGYLEEARIYLEKAKACISDTTEPTLVKMIRFLELFISERGEESEEYETLLKEIYEIAGQTLGYGFKQFHGKLLIGVYKKKRRYKEAIEILEEISTLKV